MQKNYNKELDFILELLVKEYEEIYNKLSFFSEENSDTTKQNVFDKVKEVFGLKDWEINILIYSLFLDKYVKSIEPLVISIEGLVFRNNGGYTEKSIMLNRESNRIQNVENDFRKYSFYLMIFTAILAIANLIAAWFFTIEIYSFYKNIKM
jgi:hypothetical protein